jgi:hypothetical protein
MSGLWGAPGVPQRGWVCVAMDDLGAPSEVCEMCGHAHIRYVHTMRHRDYSGDLECGCVCAGYMAEDMRAAEQREKKLEAGGRHQGSMADAGVEEIMEGQPVPQRGREQRRRLSAASKAIRAPNLGF